MQKVGRTREKVKGRKSQGNLEREGRVREKDSRREDERNRRSRQEGWGGGLETGTKKGGMGSVGTGRKILGEKTKL